MPERDVLEADLCVAAQDASEAAEPLGDDRVALVRHRRGALLTLGERLLDLAHLGPLEVADLGREALDPRARNRDPGEQHGVPVTRDHLGRDVLRPEAQLLHHPALDRRRHRRIGPDRPGDLADGDLLEGVLETAQVPVGLERERCQLQAEGRGLSVDAVGAADAEHVAEFARAPDQRIAVDARAGDDDLAGLLQLQCQRVVDDVVGGEAVVEPAAGVADRRRDHVDERRHVMTGGPLALLDRLDGEGRLLAALAGVRLGDHALLGPGIDGGELHLKERLHASLRRPDGADLLAGVAGDHVTNV